MIKRSVSVLIALVMLFCAAAIPALGAGREERAPIFTLNSGDPEKPSEEPSQPPEATDTPEPTATPEPTETPTEAPTEAPSETPSAETPKPTKTPKPTNTPAPATQTPKPSGTPTPTPAPQTDLAITTSSIPSAKVGESYQCRIEANYGDAKFSVSSGDISSIGLKLSADGVLGGTPTAAGSYKFTVSASSGSAGQTVKKDFTLEVRAASTAAPTNTPAPQTPAPTGGTIIVTAAPTNTPAPTQQGSYIAYPLWQGRRRPYSRSPRARYST